MNLIEPGRYMAKVLDHGITETKAGLPQAVIRFGFETKEGHRELNWYGSFKDGALEFTLETLVLCGLKDNNPAGSLVIGREVSIVVETKADGKGVDQSVIRWVNRPMGILRKLPDNEARAKLEKFSNAVMAFKQKSDVVSEPWDTDEKYHYT